MDKIKLIEILQKHKEFITKEEDWDNYAQSNSLPSSLFLKKTFKSWSHLKKTLVTPTKGRGYNEETLKKIAKANKEYMATRELWDKYSKVSNLPSSSTYTRFFGKWSKVKEIAGFTNPRQRKKEYCKKEIFEILKEHVGNFENRKQWDEYAMKHSLPIYSTIRKHFDYDEILGILKKRKNYKQTKNDLLEVAKAHEVFLISSMKSWNLYALKKIYLPVILIYENLDLGKKRNKKFVKVFSREFLIHQTLSRFHSSITFKFIDSRLFLD